MPFQGNGWRPTQLTRFIKPLGTATGTAVVETDAGVGYLKALGNPEGPHALACEFVGTSLADWLGLPTLDFSLVEVHGDDDIPFLKGGKAEHGPAFISKSEEDGFPWGGSAQELKAISNSQDINGLVAIDTWILNCDRYSPDGTRRNLDNVFFVLHKEAGKGVVLKAIDFTHAFTCGGEINRRIGFIERIQHPRIYGLFPEFRNYLDPDVMRGIAIRLGEFNRVTADRIIGAVPAEWDVNKDSRAAWATFITDRAHFLADHLEEILWPQQGLGGLNE